MRLFDGLGCSVSLLKTSHTTPKSDVELTVFGTAAGHRWWCCFELVLEIGAPREARWRCLAASVGSSWLDCALHFDVMTFAVSILATDHELTPPRRRGSLALASRGGEVRHNKINGGRHSNGRMAPLLVVCVVHFILN